MTSHLHISKFETHSFSNKIHKSNEFFSLPWRDTLFWTEKAMKYFVFTDFVEEIKDFKFWNVDVIFVPISEKVTCINFGGIISWGKISIKPDSVCTRVIQGIDLFRLCTQVGQFCSKKVKIMQFFQQLKKMSLKRDEQFLKFALVMRTAHQFKKH